MQTCEVTCKHVGSDTLCDCIKLCREVLHAFASRLVLCEVFSDILLVSVFQLAAELVHCNLWVL